MLVILTVQGLLNKAFKKEDEDDNDSQGDPDDAGKVDKSHIVRITVTLHFLSMNSV